ncbi:UNVERIFIED_CONTAM: hypothetical protein PYX00_005806 [Menopon gallinae]|uniref:Uncharacterized protein n=1 Tax=Menopon gallinae TaxID=328185 RepID=A0AAW2HTL3_9NEOP
MEAIASPPGAFRNSLLPLAWHQRRDEKALSLSLSLGTPTMTVPELTQRTFHRGECARASLPVADFKQSFQNCIMEKSKKQSKTEEQPEALDLFHSYKLSG